MRRMFTEKQVEDIAKSVAPSESDIQEAVANVDDGTIAESIGLDSDGKLVKGEVGGVSIYKHTVTVNYEVGHKHIFEILSSDSQPINSLDTLAPLISHTNSVKQFIENFGTSINTSTNVATISKSWTELVWYGNISISQKNSNLHIDCPNGTCDLTENTYNFSSISDNVTEI